MPKEIDLQMRATDALTYRAIPIKPDTIDEENRSVEAVIASENMATVVDWENYRLINEILLVDGMEVTGDQVPLLDSHIRYKGVAETVLGSIRDIEKQKPLVVARLFYAKDHKPSDDVWNLVKQRHVTDVSCGYKVSDYEDIKPGESSEVNGKKYENKWNLVLRISICWVLKEGSNVAIGADEISKIRSSADVQLTKVEPINMRVNIMPEPELKIDVQPEVKVDTSKIERDAADKAGKNRATEINEIYALAAKWNMREAADEAIKEGKSLEEFRAIVLDKGFEEKQEIDTKGSDLGLNAKEVKEYNLGRAIRAVIMENPQDAALEFETSREMAKKHKMDFNPKRILVPNEILHRMNHIDPQFAQYWRAMTTSSGGTGLVGTDHLAGSFIDMLRNRLALGKLGIRMLTGLTGNQSIPKQTGAAAFEWVTEGGSVTGGDPSYGTIAASPKTGRGKVSFSRELLLQSNPSIDGLVFDDLTGVMALGFDLGGINGAGSGGAPTGLLNTSGIGDVVGTSLDWPGLVEFETDVRAANGDVGTMGFLTNASVNGLLKTREKASGYPVYLIEEGKANGYPVEVSNQVPANTAIFGVFSQLMLALWGVLAIEVDIYTDADNGNIVVRSFQSGDWVVRQAAAFSASDEIS